MTVPQPQKANYWFRKLSSAVKQKSIQGVVKGINSTRQFRYLAQNFVSSGSVGLGERLTSRLCLGQSWCTERKPLVDDSIDK